MKFDNSGERKLNRSQDKLQLIRNAFDLWNSTLQNDFILGAKLSVDEKLLTFRDGCHCRQCIPSKPDKWVTKFWVIWDSQVTHTGMHLFATMCEFFFQNLLTF